MVLKNLKINIQMNIVNKRIAILIKSGLLIIEVLVSEHKEKNGFSNLFFFYEKHKIRAVLKVKILNGDFLKIFEDHLIEISNHHLTDFV